MANTIQIKRKTTPGAPLLSSLLDGEMCLVVPDSNLYQRVSSSELILVNGGGAPAPKNVYYDQIWGEESGNFSASSAGGYQYSYGNGETGETGGVSVYVPPGYTAAVVGMTFCSKGTSTGVVDLVISRTLQGVNFAVASTASNTSTLNLATPIPISNGAKLTFRTMSVSAASDGNVATAIIKFTEV